MRARGLVVTAVLAVVAVLVAAVVVLVVRGGGGQTAPRASDGFVEPASTTPEPTPAAADPAVAATSCPDQVARPFEPARITVAGVARRVPVITPPRDANNVPGIPPLTGDGKRVFAYDREQKVQPGSDQGNVLLNAHTFPDGSALGNKMLDGLRRDGRIVVEGAKGQKLCYRVNKRVEVLATANVPAYYSRNGTPQLAIIVCSGQRLGPGQWTKRTIWYAVPSS